MSPKRKNQIEIEGRPVWAEVSASALTHNLHAIRDFVNPANEKRKTPRKVLSIVKGNGYGHGGPQVAKILETAGSLDVEAARAFRCDDDVLDREIAVDRGDAGAHL